MDPGVKLALSITGVVLFIGGALGLLAAVWSQGKRDVLEKKED